jgi:hypothetical protein
MKYSTEYILEQLQLYYTTTGKKPTKHNFTKANGYISNWVVIDRFGSWNAGLEAAGLTITMKQKANNTWDKQSILEYISNFIKSNNKYPNSSCNDAPSLSTIKRYFLSWEDAYAQAGHHKIAWDKRKIVNSVLEYYSTFNSVPTSKDFRANTIKYPNSHIINTLFGSWNNLIESCNLPISIKNGYGLLTKAKDGHVYRSSAEAHFVDQYLYNKYEYIIEPNYPNPYNSLIYDWYLPELDLYIELDGNLRPETTKEKIYINNKLNRNCKFINTALIYKKQSLESLI